MRSIGQELLVVYRDAKKKDPEIARRFANGMIEDFPGAPGSALKERLMTLGEACCGFRAVARSGNPSLVWQALSRSVHYSQEFLDGLLGHLLIAWSCAIGRPIDIKAIGYTFANKVDRFSALTGGKISAFDSILRLADSKLRNGLAHGTAWMDQEAGKVRYSDGRESKTEFEMPILDFATRAKVGCDLSRAYVAALAAIVLLEDGGPVARSLMPEHLPRVFSR